MDGLLSRRDLPGLSLSDVTIPAGPNAATIAKAFDALVADARRCGVTLAVSSDFDELVRVNEANMRTWFPLLGTGRPDCMRLHEGNAFWLRGTDGQGDVVLTRAVRIFELGQDRTLHDELASLRLFHDEPDVTGTAGEFCTVEAVAPRGIRGIISFQHGAWHRPDYRGRGLSAISSRLTKLLTLVLPKLPRPWIWTSLVDDHLARPLAASYGVERREPGIAYAKHHGTETENLWLFWMLMGDVMADLDRYAAKQDLRTPPTDGRARTSCKARESAGWCGSGEVWPDPHQPA